MNYKLLYNWVWKVYKSRKNIEKLKYWKLKSQIIDCRIIIVCSNIMIIKNNVYKIFSKNF
jgi:hypothetical protein